MSNFKFLKPCVHTVFVMLGHDCNLSCRYCLQHDVVTEQLSTNINPDLVNFIAELADTCDGRLRVQFYGGEPLVYWSSIVKVVNELTSLHANAAFSMITNGKLLTSDKVEFINANFDGISVSWDGRGSLTTRGYNVVADNREQLFRLTNLCLSGVLSAYSYPLDLIKDFEVVNAEYLEATGRTLMLNIDELLDVNLQNHDLKDFDFAKLQGQVVEICQEYLDHVLTNRSMSKPRLTWIETKVNNARAGLSSGLRQFARCGNGYSVLNIDLDGNMYNCHNTSARVGTIYDDAQTIFGNAARLDQTERNNTRCSACPVRSICASGCPLVEIDARRDFYCRQVIAINAPIVDIVLKFDDLLGQCN